MLFVVLPCKCLSSHSEPLSPSAVWFETGLMMLLIWRRWWSCVLFNAISFDLTAYCSAIWSFDFLLKDGLFTELSIYFQQTLFCQELAEKLVVADVAYKLASKDHHGNLVKILNTFWRLKIVHKRSCCKILCLVANWSFVTLFFEKNETVTFTFCLAIMLTSAAMRIASKPACSV